MKRSQALIYTPAAIAILVAAAGIATFEANSGAPVRLESAPVSVAPPAGDVPFLGEITVTARAFDSEAADIAVAASI